MFSFEDLDFSEFIKPYADLQKEYEDLVRKKNLKKHRAFKVTFKDSPDLLYFTFTKSRDYAKGEAVKYFKENFHPSFMGRGWRKQYLKAVGARVPALDKYNITGKVPIPELMKHLNISFCCSVCGKEVFSYSDYEKKKCYFVEGEGDLNEHTSGLILCYNCYKKYFTNQE